LILSEKIDIKASHSYSAKFIFRKTKFFNKPLVGIVMGSDSDFSIMKEARKVLEEFNVAHEVLITSAHRTPERTRKYV
jgi:phosphoribosylcarboxyaminoimidazole (NCAIR) mutase